MLIFLTDRLVLNIVLSNQQYNVQLHLNYYHIRQKLQQIQIIKIQDLQIIFCPASNRLINSFDWLYYFPTVYYNVFEVEIGLCSGIFVVLLSLQEVKVIEK